MRAVLLPGNRRCEVREVPEPEPGPGQVVLRMRASGICGSDMWLYRIDPEKWHSGKIAGHEPCGVVEAVGPGVGYPRVGDRVMVYHVAGCGHCKHCRAGWSLHCTEKSTYGWDRDGGDADLMLVEARDCVPMPDELGFVDGAYCSCAGGTAYQALKRLSISGRDTLAVMGLGPVGLAATLFAKAMGARVIGVDTVPLRIELARNAGADEVLEAGPEVVEQIRELTEGEGAEASVDCSGKPAGRNNALDCVRIWGRVAFVGEDNPTTIDPSPQMIWKELTVYGSWVFGITGLDEVARFLVRHNLSLDKTFVTHRVTLDQAPQMFKMVDQGSAGKIAFVW